MARCRHALRWRSARAAAAPARPRELPGGRTQPSQKLSHRDVLLTVIGVLGTNIVCLKVVNLKDIVSIRLLIDMYHVCKQVVLQDRS